MPGGGFQSGLISRRRRFDPSEQREQNQACLSYAESRARKPVAIPLPQPHILSWRNSQRVCLIHSRLQVQVFQRQWASPQHSTSKLLLYIRLAPLVLPRVQRHWSIVQLEEHRSPKPKVEGSSPSAPAILRV